MGLVITHAWLDGQQVDIHTDAGRITAVVPAGEREVAPGAEVLDASGLTAVPGLVNAHTHAAMTLFRGFGDDLPLQQWLNDRIWPAEARLSEDDVYWGTKLACLEMLRSGTVGFWDMYWHVDGAARAVTEMGLRATLSAVAIDNGSFDRARIEDSLATAREAVARCPERLRLSLGPHAVYTVSQQGLEWFAQRSADEGLAVQIHCAETAKEVDDCVTAHGVRPVEYLHEVGLLSDRCVLGHAVWLDDHDYELLEASGATLAPCPASELKLGSGLFAYGEARRRGLPIALGTDGAASNNSLDLYQEMKLMALVARLQAGDLAVGRAGDVLALGRGALSALTGAPGRIEAGAPADVVLVDAALPGLAPGLDLTSNLVYAATGECVRTVVIDGVVRMRDRQVPGEEDIVAEATARARAVCAG